MWSRPRFNFFANKKLHVTSTDFSEEAINYVNKIAVEQNLENLVGKVLDMKNEFNFENKFHCVYSNLALQFFKEIELKDIFKKVFSSLEEGGSFMFSTKKPGDKYHKVGEQVNENAYRTRGITRYFFDKEVIEELLGEFFTIENMGHMDHVNLDKSVSAWWYFINKKV